MKFKILVATAISAVTLSNVACAQQAASNERYVIGGGLYSDAEYVGGDKHRVKPVIFFDFQNAQGLFASLRRGFGYEAQFGASAASVALGYEPGRQDSKSNSLRRGSDDLRGMGNIAGTAQLRLAGRLNLGDINANLGVNFGTSNDVGNTYLVGLSGHFLRTQTNQVKWDVATNWGDRNHNQAFFGVTAAQSLRSGYRVFSPKSGLETVTANIAWTHVFNANWSITNGIGLVSLAGDAADSPIVKNKGYGTFVSTVNYSF